MGRRILRWGSAAAAAALILIGTSPAALAGSATASVAGSAVAGSTIAGTFVARDFCTPGDPNSVTVVVDFSGVSGGIDIRCAAVSTGASGAQALSAAGFSIAGTVHDGPAFVCRIDGEPASDPCVDTPPTSAYWSYHQAASGGGWSYASSGFASSRVKPGGFEGWSYGSGGSPGVDPVLPAAPEPEPAPAPEQAAEQPAEQPAAPDQAAPGAAPEQAAAAPADQALPGTDQQSVTDPADAVADQAAADIAAQSAAEDAAAQAAAAEGASASAAAQASADAAAALAAQSLAAESAAAQSAAAQSAASGSAAAAAAASGRASSSGPTTSSGESSTLGANDSTGGSTLWFSVIALLAVVSLGSAAIVMSRRRSAGAGAGDAAGDVAGDDRAG